MRWRGLVQPRGAVLLISQRLCAARPPTRARNAPSAPVDRITGWLGGSPRRRLRLSSLPTSPGFPPSRAAPSISSAGGSELSFHQMTGVSPMSKGSSFPFAGGSELPSPYMTRGFPSGIYLEVFPFAGGPGSSSPYMTRGFPSAIYLEVFPFAGGPRSSSHHATRGFPSATQPEVLPAPVAQSFLRHHAARGFPSAAQPEVFPAPVAQSFLLRTWLGVSPPPCTLKFPCAGGPRFPLRVSPLPGGTGLSPRPEAPKFAQYRVARGFPRTGGSEFPPCRWRRTSPGPKARSCPLPGGSGFPLRRLPSLVVRKFLRLSPKLHKGFRASISRFFRRPQAIHS